MDNLIEKIKNQQVVEIEIEEFLGTGYFTYKDVIMGLNELVQKLPENFQDTLVDPEMVKS